MIIAEIAQAHDGSLGIAHSYIDALAGTGIDAIKFQTHIADAESSAEEPFRVQFSYEDATRYDYWKRMEFSFEEWKGLKQHCEDRGLEFMSSPFSNAAVDLLEKLDIKRYKIGSGEITNHLLLEKVAITKKPVILSSGMSDWGELDAAVEIFQKKDIDVTVLQCTSAYPCSPEQWGLNVLEELRERYHVKIGFSDHSGDIYACLAAATLGAEVFEFHIVFHKKMFGPDASASIVIDKVAVLTKGIGQIKAALSNKIEKGDVTAMQPLKRIFEKSLAVNRRMSKGERIYFELLEAKKPSSKGIPANEYKKVLGKTIDKDKAKWNFLTGDDIVG